MDEQECPAPDKAIEEDGIWKLLTLGIQERDEEIVRLKTENNALRKAQPTEEANMSEVNEVAAEAVKQTKPEDVTFGRLSKQDLALLKHLKTVAEGKKQELDVAVAVFNTVGKLLDVRYSFPKNAEIDFDNGDIIVREKNPGKP